MKTQTKIRSALTEMLETMPVEDITATELCRRAEVNRATFYYHYNCVQDVLAEIEKQIEKEFIAWMSQTTVTTDGQPAKSFYVTFFEFIARNVGVCKMLLNSKRPNEFLSRAVEAGRMKVASVMTKLYPECPAAKIDYYYIFVSNGFLGLLTYWLNSGMHESINDVAEIGERVSQMGIKYLEN